MREAEYQSKLIQKLRILFPGCVILKNDSGYLQGVPDLAIFYQNYWAMLEVKTSPGASRQQNQLYWIDVLDGMSFAAFIHPQNEEAVLNALQKAFGVSGKARVS